MAVTIQSSPQNFNTASNPCEFTFSSTNTGEDNFSFLVRLTINGSIHSYHQVFVESGIYGRFDVSEILRSYVSSELVVSGVVELDTSTYTATYSISVKEKYGAPPIEVGSYATSSTLTAINGSLRHIDWVGYDYTDYALDVDTANQGKYLTYFPSTAYRFCGVNESIFLGFIAEGANPEYTCSLLDASGSLVAGVASIITAMPSNDFAIFDFSPQTLIADTSLTSDNFDDTYYYIIALRSSVTGTGDRTMPSITIYIDRECSLYNGKRLHWINKFGVWESFTFRLYNEENTIVRSKSYQKSLGGWNASNQRVYNRLSGQSTVINKTAEDTLTLNSDWIKEDVQQWLSRSLYESPRVYLEISQGVYDPVEVRKSSYTQKQRIKEGLIQENVEIKKTFNYQSQLN